MSVKRVPPPPQVADVLDERGRISRSWLEFFSSLQRYASQQGQALTDLDTNISAPSAIGDAAKLSDLKATMEQINEIQSRLRTT